MRRTLTGAGLAHARPPRGCDGGSRARSPLRVAPEAASLHREGYWQERSASSPFVSARPSQTNRELILPKHKSNHSEQTGKNGNPCFSDTLILSEQRFSFQHRDRPTVSHVARGLSRSTWKKVFCTEQVFFRLSGKGPRPSHSDPQGKSELSVQRPDRTFDQCHCRCHCLCLSPSTCSFASASV